MEHRTAAIKLTQDYVSWAKQSRGQRDIRIKVCVFFKCVGMFAAVSADGSEAVE